MVNKLGAGPLLYFLLSRARASSRKPLEQLQRKQVHTLRRLLAHAYRNVPLYRSLYTDAGFHPDHFRTLDDLPRIPVLQKARLQAARPHELVAAGIDRGHCQSIATSGSTGSPLRILLGPYETQWQRAVAWRILLEHGFRWTDRTVEIRMTLGKHYRLQDLGIARKRWLSVLDSPESWVQELIECRPEVLVAGAGTLQVLAETLESLGLRAPAPRIVLSDSETLLPGVRRLVERALGRQPVDVYGLAELSNFAWECQLRRGFHVSADSHVVEVDAPPGRTGPLIATALGMWTMPIIRYDTGDLACVAPAPCACGRTLPLLQNIYGRAVDSITLPDGRLLLWPFFHELLAGFDSLQQWRVVQDQPHRLTVQLVIGTADTELCGRIQARVREAIPAAMEVSVERVPSLAIESGQKVRMVQSSVARGREGTVR